MSTYEEYSCVRENGINLFSNLTLPYPAQCLGTVGIFQNNFDNTFTLSPNPTHDFCTVNSSSVEIKNIIVFDVTGKVKKTQIEKKIDLSELANGIYFIEIDFKNGKRSYSKIIRE